MISITASPEAPPPRIRILDARQREVETVRIGDRLTFRIEIPEDSKEKESFFQFNIVFIINIHILISFYIFSSVWYLRSQLCCYG